MKTAGLHLLGDRDYLHGATIFDCIMNTYVINQYEPGDIDFSIKKITNKICLIVPAAKNAENLLPELLIGEYEDNVNHFIIQETGDLITERVPYDEDEITRGCIISGDNISVSADILNYSFMKKAIAAYKFLLTSLYGKSYGRYLFARVQLKSLPDGGFSIKHDRIISNRFFQGTVMQNNVKSGNIFFGIRDK